MKMSLLVLLAVFFSAVIVFSSYQLWRYNADDAENAEQYIELYGLIRHPSLTVAPEPEQSETSTVEWTVYDQYGELFAQNPDMIGWISIDGTGMDYPVMQTPDRPDFYLNHDFEKKHSDYGVPYAAESCKIDPQSDNITIYGHHMKSGKMFGVLEKYRNEAFYREHPLIRFDTRAGFGTYEIIAAFKVHPNDFKYNLFINAVDETEFDGHVRQCKALSFYNTGLTAVYGDKLISLSTCDNSRQNNRIVVVARKV